MNGTRAPRAKRRKINHGFHRRNDAPLALSQDNFPTWIAESEVKSPKTFRSHRTTLMTTTPFKIDLIDPAIGM